MYRACELKDQTCKKTRTLHFSDSSQFAARIRRGFFTLGDGCWLPKKGLFPQGVSEYGWQSDWANRWALIWSHSWSSAPRCGSGPKRRLEAPPPSTPLRPRTPPPPPAWAAPSRSLAKRAKGGGGKSEGEGGEGGGLAWGKGPPITMGDGGDPPNTSWGQTHIWGLPTWNQSGEPTVRRQP